MKKNALLLFIAVLFTGFFAKANPVNQQTAQVVALNFYKLTYPGAVHHVNLTATLKYTKIEADGTIDFYVFDMSPVTGFVAVSAQDAVIPVLAYSNESPFVFTGYEKYGLINWVTKTAKQIYNTKLQNIVPDARVSNLWTDYLAGIQPVNLKSGPVAPMVQTTWDQSPYYNDSCPANPNNNNLAVTGCVATAMAQIMRFWSYPPQGQGSSSYCDCTASGYTLQIGTLSANYGNTTYSWPSMPLSISSSNPPIAQLMEQAGISVAMDYSDAGSGAYVTQAEANAAFNTTNAPCSQYSYVNYFKYNSATIQGVVEASYSSSAWTTLIENDLNAGRPVQYEGQDPNAGGHTWVCDGYDANNNLHMNWGWSGQSDGYFAINNLSAGGYTFSQSDGALIGIEPPTGPPTASFTANVTSTCTGVVQFTDISSGSPTTWAWNFGDGSTSTSQNPSHTYLTNGSFTVTLTATNSYGSNTKTMTAYITVNKPTGPTVTGGGIHCGSSTFTLSAATTNPVTWLDSLGDVVSHANPFTTPTLTHTTTYSVIDTVLAPTYTAGPANNTFSTGGYLNAAHNLVFNVLKAGTLVSVYVYAQAAGSQTFTMTDGTNTLATTTVNVPAGGSTVTLNFDLPVGGPYYIGPTSATINLYRNNAGAAYPYTDANGIVSITGNDASGVPAYYYFLYNWVVKEHNCVSQPTSVTAGVSPAIVIGPGSVTNPACNGSTNGSATVAVSGGTPAYTYHWSNNQSTATASNLDAGTYTVTITDAASCTSTASKTLTAPSAISVSVTPVNAACGSNNGSVTTTASGGTQGYTYSWSNSATTANISSLAAGSYTLTVTDAHNCTATATAIVNSAGSLNAAATAVNPTCYGESNGSASVTVSGSTGTVTYSWSNGLTTSTISNLAAGTYTVTVSDGSGCSAIATKVITQPAGISLNITPVNTGCGSSTGSATVAATGGASGFSYHWSNNATTATITGLGVGNYTVTVTDANSCTSSAAVTISSASNLVSNTSNSNVLCFGNNTGSATVNVSSGTGPFTYNWNTGSTTNSITNVVAGTYQVTITDANNCQKIDSVVISQPTQLSATVNTVNETCFGDQKGQVQLSVSGGTGSYIYDWSNGEHGSTLSNVGAGSYSVTITDNNNCTSLQTATISQPALLVATTSSTPASAGQSNGSATVNISGGTTPYQTIAWSNGQTTATATALAAGTYTVTVTDNSGCVQTATATVSVATGINDPGVLNFSVYPNPASTQLFVQLGDLASETVLSVKNVLGQTMVTQTSTNLQSTINLSTLADGVYFIEVRQADKMAVREFVVRR